MSDNRLMTCEQLDERLADWLERDLDASTRAELERHVSDCPRCTALVADLDALRREAAALPALVPSRDLWPEIEARIQAPVITLDRSALPEGQLRAARSAGVAWTGRGRWWMAVAAAGLVAVTAGVTYVVTVGIIPEPTMASSDPAVVRTPDTAQREAVSAAPVSLASESNASNARVPSGQGAGAPWAGRPSGPAARSPRVEEASEYSRDVAQLRAIVTQRRADLDSTTIAVLEKNLELIDRAIAESRAALERDPASEFLADQLARAMTKKVAILRTAALLPARS